MKYRLILPTLLLAIFAGLWMISHTGSPQIEVSSNGAIEALTKQHIPEMGCDKTRTHEGCKHGSLSLFDPITLAQNDALSKKRLFTEIPVNQNGSRLIESVGADSDWKSQIGGAVRARQITVSPKFLNKKPFQKGEVLTLNLFDDVVLNTVVYESFSNVNETISTTARVGNTMFGRAVMAFTENELRVKVILPESNKIYEIQYNHDDGNHYVLEMDPSIVDNDVCGIVEGSPFANPPEAASEETVKSGEFSSPPRVAGDEGVALVVIDTLVVYPENVVTSAGSEANVRNIAAQGIALTNDAHIATNTGMYINLVHTARLTGYNDTGNQGTDLNRITYVDQNIDMVHAWRYAYGADFVQMMHGANGGLGWIPNFATTDPGRPDLAFSVVGWQSFVSYTPAHEMGHNMNLDHSKFQSVDPGTPTAPTGTDAAGWHWHPDGNTALAGHCSIMSYQTYPGESSHTKVGLFSDPNIIHNGQPAGHITDANAARVLRLHKNIYASYRTRPLATNSILVESPNGGEVFSRGQTVEIQWNSNIAAGNIKLELYRGAAFEREITAGTINDRIYYYTIPNDLPSSSLYKVRISSVNNPAIHDFSDVDFTITQPIYATNLDTNPGFTITGGSGSNLWQYGVPGGTNPDYGGPGAAYTGTNIYDTNLSGASSGTLYLRTPAINCSNFQGVTLKFAGQFSVTSGYQANVEVSNDGTTWQLLSSVSNTFVTTWSQYSFDISEWADGQSTVYVRWVHLSVTGGSVRSGMSVDDISITGVALPAQPIISASVGSLTSDTLIGNSPGNQNFTVKNAGINTLNYTISDNQSWLSVSPSSGTSTGEEDIITVTYSTSGLSRGNYSATITISDNAAGNSPVTIPVFLSVIAPPIYFANMDADPGWTFSHPSWAYGVTTGGQQDVHGNPDPTSGYTGANVIGYKLDGDYEGSVSPTRWATTPAINCVNHKNVKLSFRRWLGVEGFWDKAYIEVSNNGSSWTQVWENSNTDGVNENDPTWVLVEYDISAVADGKSTVYVRWGLTSDSSWNFCGWNLDDVRIDGEYNGYSNWSAGVFANPPFSQTGLNLNHDSDILTNIQEYAFGTDPTSPAIPSLAYNVGGEITQPGIPVLRYATSKYHAVFSRRKNYLSTGLVYTVQFSADLNVWTSYNSSIGTVLTGAGSNPYEAVSVEFPATVPVQGGGAEQAPKFFRVGVVQN